LVSWQFGQFTGQLIVRLLIIIIPNIPISPCFGLCSRLICTWNWFSSLPISILHPYDFCIWHWMDILWVF
jgi:hypothetical protein